MVIKGFLLHAWSQKGGLWLKTDTPSVQLLPWLDTLVDLLKKMMRYEPSARIRPRQALEHEFFSSDVDQPAPLLRRGSSRQRSEEIIVLEDWHFGQALNMFLCCIHAAEVDRDIHKTHSRVVLSLHWMILLLKEWSLNALWYIEKGGLSISLPLKLD